MLSRPTHPSTPTHFSLSFVPKGLTLRKEDQTRLFDEISLRPKGHPAPVVLGLTVGRTTWAEETLFFRLPGGFTTIPLICSFGRPPILLRNGQRPPAEDFLGILLSFSWGAAKPAKKKKASPTSRQTGKGSLRSLIPYVSKTQGRSPPFPFPVSISRFPFFVTRFLSSHAPGRK